MASIQETSASYTIPVNSFETALCILPPIEQCEHIESLRELYDKAYGKWPAHINVIYPFVAPELLPRAQQQIQAQIHRNLNSSKTRQIAFGRASLFGQKHDSTVILQESQDFSDGILEELQSLALTALGHKPTKQNFHLTVGQTGNNSIASLEFLVSKARLLPTLHFQIGTLAILIRERTSGPQSAMRMRFWGSIHTGFPGAVPTIPLKEYWLSESSTCVVDTEQEEDKHEMSDTTTTFNRAVQPGKTFTFDNRSGSWIKANTLEPDHNKPTSLAILSYNILVDSEYPPARDRDPLLISTLLSESAKADIVILQEVSDDFLCALLSSEEIRSHYPFTSHGPPSQADIGPLPSLRNVVVISRLAFRWTLVPFHRRHKGAVVAVFDSIFSDHPLVVAGVHLTCGLTDGSVAAKKVQLQNLLNHLNRQHSDSPWIIAGDFNLATSAHTIDNALKSKAITSQTGTVLAAIESRISEAGLTDAWSVAREDHSGSTNGTETDNLFEGEDGATFDPRNNVLAAATSGTSQNRPQRYDRILVRSLDMLRISKFNMFGLPTDVQGRHVVPSDHYGIRTTVQLSNLSEQLSADHLKVLGALEMEVKHRAHLSSLDLASALHIKRMFLSDKERMDRKLAFNLLKEVVIGSSLSSAALTADIPLAMVAVGSFALNVDTSTSDIDCLCIGSISSKMFFKLARQRLRKAESRGVRILRKVEAGTGTMLELSVNGIAMDLQYCPAARVVERWSEFDILPATDPIFNLSILSLRKLKPYRDMLYIKRTIADLETFSLAYRAIKLWATQRGIYSSKFGYLGGVHITLMLSWVYKRVAYDLTSHEARSIGAGDLVATFFQYYTNFNWAEDIVFDAFFHKQKPRYHRSAREPMVVLGFHPPNSNVAHTSTLPGLLVLQSEFNAANLRLADPGVTWSEFFELPRSHSLTGVGLGEAQFLQTYNSYVSIDINFWGRTLAKGKSLVGWVESRCLSLVVDIHKRFPILEVRLWPARFTDKKPDKLPESQDYHGCYLIGLQKCTHVQSASIGKEERQSARRSLEKIIDKFLTQLRTDEKNYDTSTSWVNASLVTQHDVRTQNFQLDDREWGDYSTEIEPDSEDDEELDDLDAEDADLPKLPVRSKPTSTPTPISTTKLRPASDVLNRLRWDPNLDPADYIIGYEDRFLGAKETSLEKWKTEQTDEEFIPQHRILYFRRTTDCEGDGKGQLIWERATRIDTVFRSGASANM